MERLQDAFNDDSLVSTWGDECRLLEERSQRLLEEEHGETELLSDVDGELA